MSATRPSSRARALATPTIPSAGLQWLTAMLALALAIAAITVAPSAAATNPTANSQRGLVVTESTQDFETTWSTLIGALEVNPAIRVIDTVDHAAAAASVGLELEPNRVVYFGNPNLGTPIMQEAQTAGIDLPQRLHVYVQDARVFVAYNSTDVLADRHDASGAPTLDTIAGALARLSGGATGADVDTNAPGTERYRNRSGLVTVDSANDFETTWSNLVAAIDASPAGIFLTLDHQANAANVGLDLDPTRLLVFGNPNLGTPLMQAAPSSGIDLPLRMLVWQDGDGQVFVTYNAVRWLDKRHRIGDAPTLPTIEGALARFVEAATS